MTPEENDEKLLRCCMTLVTSINLAHGGITLEMLKQMSAIEFIKLIAPNDIVFVYSPPKVDKVNQESIRF